MPRGVPPSVCFAIAHRQLPRKRWRLIVRFISLHIKPALKGEVAMSVSELTEGLKKKVASLGIVNPSVGYADSSP